MTHRAEQIMATVLTTVTGLTTTAARVQRGRVRSIETAPALSIEMGSDDVAIDRSSYPNIERDLNIKITIYVKENDNPEAEMNLIREEVYAAIMATPQLGLAYVVDTMPIGDEEPELTGEADKILRKQQMNFIVMYRHSWDNPGV